MDALTLLVSLGGPAVAAFALWLNHRERGATYRTALYTRQIEAHLAIADAMNVLTAHLIPHIPSGDLPLTEDDRLMIRDESEASHNAFVQTWTKAAPILPQRTLEAMLLVTDTYSAIAAPSDPREAVAGRPVHTSAEARLVVDSLLGRVFAAMRDALRTDALSEATLRVVGLSSREVAKSKATKAAVDSAVRLAMLDARVDVLTARHRAAGADQRR